MWIWAIRIISVFSIQIKCFEIFLIWPSFLLWCCSGLSGFMHTVPILYERHLTIPIESMYNDNKCRLLIMRCKLLEWYYILWNQSGKSCLPFIGDVWAKKYKIRVRYFVNLKKVLFNWMSSSIPSSWVRLHCSALLLLALRLPAAAGMRSAVLDLAGI